MSKSEDGFSMRVYSLAEQMQSRAFPFSLLGLEEWRCVVSYAKSLDGTGVRRNNFFPELLASRSVEFCLYDCARAYASRPDVLVDGDVGLAVICANVVSETEKEFLIVPAFGTSGFPGYDLQRSDYACTGN